MWVPAFLLAACLVVTLPGYGFAAGAVSTAVVDDTLVVTGDDLGNQIDIARGAALGTWQLRGLDGTTIDGTDATNLPATRHLRLAMGAGPDDVTLDRIAVRGRVLVAGGDGEDRLLFRGVRIRGALTVRAGRGSDVIDVHAGFHIGGAVTLLGGAGGDRVVFERGRLDGVTIVVTGDGDDDVWVLDVDARHAPTLRVVTGNGRDDVTLEDSDFGDDVRVRLGEDDDDLWISHAGFDDDLELNGGDDDDDLVVGRFVDVDGDLDVDAFEDWW